MKLIIANNLSALLLVGSILATPAPERVKLKRLTSPSASDSGGIPSSSISSTNIVNAQATSSGITLTSTSRPLSSSSGNGADQTATSSSSSSPSASATSASPVGHGGATCGKPDPVSLVNCLFDTTQQKCSAYGGGCAVLGAYLPVALDDKKVCEGDVTIAAQVCAQCNGTQVGYDLYNQYLTKCGVGQGSSSSSSPGSSSGGSGPTPSSSTFSLSTTTVSSGFSLSSGSMPSSSGASRTISSTSSASGLVPSGSSTDGALVAIETNTGLLPAQSGGRDGSGLKTVQPGSVSSSSIPGLLSSASISGSASVSGLSTGSSSTSTSSLAPLSTSSPEPEITRAYEAGKLFFDKDVSSDCANEGCQSWRTSFIVCSLLMLEMMILAAD